MQFLPSEVRTNIVEFGGEAYELSEQELVDRIKVYEPTFSLANWKGDLKMKRDTLKKVLTPNMNELYQYIKDNKISFTFPGRNEILFPHWANKIGGKVEYTIDIIRREYSTLSSYEDRLGYRYTFSPEGIVQLQGRLILLWLLKEGSSDIKIYRRVLYDLLEAKMTSRIIERIDTLSTPDTLTIQLQEAVRRNREKKRIEKLPLFPLYQLISPYRFSISVNGDYLTLYKKSGTIVPPDQSLLNAIKKILPVTDIQEQLRYWLISTKENLLQLVEIDRYYHPTVPSSVSVFS